MDSVQNIEHTLNGNHNNHGDSATPDMLMMMPDVVGNGEMQNPRKVEMFFRETSPHLFNQSPQKTRNSAVDFFDNLPRSSPISAVSVTQQEPVPYVNKSEVMSGINSERQSAVLHQHLQNKDVTTSINQSAVEQHQSLFGNDSLQPITSANSTDVFELNFKTVKDELESRLKEEHQRNYILDLQLKECVCILYVLYKQKLVCCTFGW